MWEVITGERPARGSLRMPLVPLECPQARRGCGHRDGGLARAAAAAAAHPLLRGRRRCYSSRAPCAGLHPNPKLMQTACDLMMECLSQDPAARPTANQLMRRLAAIDNGPATLRASV